MDQRERDLEGTGSFYRREPPPPLQPMDAERISFPLKLVISLMGTTVAICLFILNATWQLRSDIRDINTRSTLEETIQRERFESMKNELAGMRRMLDLQAYEMQAVKLSLSEAGIKIKYPERN